MSTPHASRVTVEVTGGVADVRLNRPDKLNALDHAMFQALADTGDALGRDRTVRAVVLSGVGRGFCAGLDFEAFASMAETPGEAGPGLRLLAARPEERPTNLGQHAAHVWTTLPVPVIAAVHGVALGGGLQIALGADLRIVAPDARLSVLEIRWGIVPDMTGTWALPRLVPLDVAKELAWTGRMVSGEEAVGLGLATRVSADPVAEALEMARGIAGRNPDAVRAAKRLFEQSGTVDSSVQFRDESMAMGSLIGTANQTEAVRAYFERREPVFADPDLV